MLTVVIQKGAKKKKKMQNTKAVVFYAARTMKMDTFAIYFALVCLMN